MRRADVLVIAHQYLPSDPRVSRQLDALADAGLGGHVICLRAPGQQSAGEYRSFRLHRLPVRHRRASGLAGYLLEYGVFFLLAFARAAVLHIRHRHPVVMTHTLPDVLVFAALVPKLNGARVVMDMHEYTPELYATRFGVAASHPLIRLMVTLEQMSCAFADRVITVHDPGVELLVSRGVPRGKVVVSMNTALMGERCPVDATAWPAPFTLVYHGTLVNQYDLDTALDAMKLLIARGVDVRLRIVGSGPQEASLRARAAEGGLGSRVSIEEPIDVRRIPALLRECDAGVVPMKDIVYAHVALPMKAMECIAEGLPVITNPTPVLRHYFGEDAIRFVPFGDAAALADAVVALKGDPALREGMARRAFDSIWPRRLQVESERVVQTVLSA